MRLGSEHVRRSDRNLLKDLHNAIPRARGPVEGYDDHIEHHSKYCFKYHLRPSMNMGDSVLPSARGDQPKDPCEDVVMIQGIEIRRLARDEGNFPEVLKAST